jgi:hypothetical protein
VEPNVAEGGLLSGRFRLGRPLGRGGMAEVFEAFDQRLGRWVAVKLLRPDLGVDPDVQRRFEVEARAAARLSHPNVVAIYDTGEDAGRAYIVMERLPGDTLGDRMAAGPMHQAWLRRLALQVLAALGAAHAAGIVHRDIKPGNILMAADGRAKVADFGIATSTERLAGSAGDLTATGMVIGTPAYLAPERIDGRPATPQSDLYALGVVMYEALAGRKPFAGATPLAVAYSARNEPAPDLRQLRPDTDPRLVAVVAQAMALDPAVRFASAEQMAAALSGHQGTSRAPTAAASGASVGSTAAFPAPAIPAPSPWPDATSLLDGPPVPPGETRSRRRRWFAVFAPAMAVVVLAAALFIAVFARGDHQTAVSTAATSTTVTPATAAPAQPANPLATRLTALANQLTAADGAAALSLRDGLMSVASSPAGSQEQVDAATALLAQATAWRQHGQLSAGAYQRAVNVLQQAGGLLPTPPTTTKDKGHKGGGSGGGD